MSQNWMRHALQRTGWNAQRQATTLLILGVILTLIFGGIYLSQVASYATTNRQIETLLDRRDRLELSNEQLRAEIASLQTLPRLLSRASELGFREATAADIEYIVVDGYNPDRDETVIPMEQMTVNDSEDDMLIQAPRYEATFSNWLELQLDNLSRQFEAFGQQNTVQQTRTE